MANTNSLKQQLQTRNTTTVASTNNTLKSLLGSDTMKKRFEEVLKAKAPQYMSSILNLYNSDQQLQQCDPMSIISSCMVAATLDLPVDKNLGYAWIVPYKGRCSMQLGWKGYVQLALRTAQYKSLNVVEIHEGELQEWNPLTEVLIVDFSKKKSDAVIGYAGYFELLNGFKKSVYWTKEEITKHKNKFSKSDFGWSKDWDAMAKKTVIRNMLSKWGILSIEMQKAYSEEIETNSSIEDEIPQDNSDLTVDANFEEVPVDTPDTMQDIPEELK